MNGFSVANHIPSNAQHFICQSSWFACSATDDQVIQATTQKSEFSGSITFYILWVSVELTEFLDNIFNMAIFKPKFNFFEILKANMVKHPERVMTI